MKAGKMAKQRADQMASEGRRGQSLLLRLQVLPSCFALLFRLPVPPSCIAFNRLSILKERWSKI